MILATSSQILGRKTAPAGDRLELSRLLYAEISGGFGLVLNLSEGGMAVQTMVPLKVGQALKFALPSGKTRAAGAGAELTGTAEVAWCDSSGRAGLHFTDVSDTKEIHFKTWLQQQGEPDSPRALCEVAIENLGSSRSSALLNAEVNCLQFLAD